MNIYSFRSLITITFLVFLSGCGGPGYKVTPVSGKVTFGDKPVANIHVSFQPKSGEGESGKPGPGSVGLTDAQGRFTLRTVDPEQDGAVVGTHVVRLSRKIENQDPTDDRSTPRQFLLPEKCRDGSLIFTVPGEGTSEANFDLQSLTSGRAGGS